MMETKIVKADFSKLNRFVRAVSEDHVVKIGIFGNKNSRGMAETQMFRGVKRRVKSRRPAEETNAEVGALHEFGSPSRKIPTRSFLRMPIEMNSEKILQKGATDLLALTIKGKWLKVLDNLGAACHEFIQRAFETRGFGFWKENSPFTIAQKGSDQPLIDTGQLRRAIMWKVE